MTTNKSNLTPDLHLAAAFILAAQKLPYLGVALSSLVRRKTPGLGTFGVTDKMIMLYDEQAMAEWSVEETAGVVVHEVMHVLRGHAKRRALLAAEPHAWNIAGDAEINDDVISVLSLPQGKPITAAALGFEPCSNDTFITPVLLGCEDGLCAEEYYAEIMKKRQQEKGQQEKVDKSECPEKSDDEGTPNGEQSTSGEDDEDGSDGDDEGQDGTDSGGGGSAGEGEPKPDVARGRCGSGAGYPVPGEPENDDKANRTPDEIEQIERDVAEAVKRHEAKKGRGSVPGGLSRWAEATLKPPKVRWQDLLSRSVRNAVAYARGMGDYTYQRRSRRQASVDYTFARLGYKDAPVLPAMRKPVPNIAVYGDTSGSMGSDEIACIISEAWGATKALGMAVPLFAGDTQAHEMRPVRTVAEMLPLLKGGNGTDLRAPFVAFDERKVPRPDVLVFVTDGGGPAPSRAPRGMQVVWVLVGPYKQRPTDETTGQPITWGTFIEVDDEPKKKAA